MKRLVIVVFILVLSVGLYGQYFGRNKIQDNKEEWSEMATLHFDLYYPKGYDEFGKQLAVLAEDTYYYLREDFEVPLKVRIPIIVYPSQQEFITTNIIGSLLSEGVGGFTESMKNRVVVPFNGSYKALEDVLTHEMTHAYINALDHQGRIKGSYGSTNSRLPFWFTEGLPEFLSLVGESANNDMYIVDLVLNDRLTPLEQVSGYFAYRQGESFLNFIYQEYGREKVMEFFFSVRFQSDLDEVSQSVFGMSFHNLELSWRNFLKRRYFAYINKLKMPYEIGERLTDHEAVGGSRNYGVKISPDGSSYIFFTDRNWRQSVWIGDLHDKEKGAKKIFTAEATGKFEEFHFDKNNLSWFSDSETFAFVSKTSHGDRIYFMNIKGKIKRVLEIPGIDTIFELDVSTDDTKLVFTAVKNLQSDLFVYDLTTDELTQFTDDIYYNHDPQFSYDGSYIAFASERDLEKRERDGYFSGLLNQIFTYNLANRQIKQITFDDVNNTNPLWVGVSNDSLLVLNDSLLSNYNLIDMENNQIAKVTNIISGILDGDLSIDKNRLLFSNYYDRGWDIFSIDVPLDTLVFSPHREEEIVHFENDKEKFYDKSKFSKIGYVKKKFLKTRSNLRNFKGTVIQFDSDALSDSLVSLTNLQIDDIVDSLAIPPLLDDYNVRFQIDHIWGGAAYSSSDGAIGFLQTSFSDLMGNHGLGVNLGLAGKLEDSSISLRYIYLPYRFDFGIGIHYINEEEVYRSSSDPSLFFRNRELQYGISTMVNYPINKFWRLEFNNTFYEYSSKWDFSTDYEDSWSSTVPPGVQYQFNDEDDAVYRPSFSIVHDNSLYGPTGPLSGWRGIYTIDSNVGSKNHNNLTNYLDLRMYKFFKKRYAVAGRVNAAFSRGDDPYLFELDNLLGVRGYDDNDPGRPNKLLASLELRFPFMDYLEIAFPLPITFGNIRGAVFTDIGAVWGDDGYQETDDSFDAMSDSGKRLKDIKMGFGFGPRFSLGYLVLKFDFAWDTDLIEKGKPTYMFSIYEEF
ncbi:MAG: hypothetical protein B6226_04555 [Candidatus Cloacimonetes bacterium 4572_65]|nr:MAG: hypothetical protein B6226_04555 [Candidatus Cloacimonetes bacterium 4572_65]